MEAPMRLLCCLILYFLAAFVGYRFGVRDGEEKLLKLFERIAATEGDDEQST